MAAILLKSSKVIDYCSQVVVEKSLIHQGTRIMNVSSCTQATCTILFQTRANQLIFSSIFSRLSLFGTKRNANTNTLNQETYLYHSFYNSLYLHLLPNHTRSKTSWARIKVLCEQTRELPDDLYDFFGLCLMLSGLRNFAVDCHI